MKLNTGLILLSLCLSVSVHAADKRVDSGYLGYKSNPVEVKFDNGKEGDTPAGTKVDVLIWSLSYTKDYVKDLLSGANKDEKKALKHSKEPNACLNNADCKAVVRKYDENGLAIRSYELSAEYGKTIEKLSLVRLLDGPYKGRKAWVKDSDLYLRR